MEFVTNEKLTIVGAAGMIGLIKGFVNLYPEERTSSPTKAFILYKL